MSQSGVNALAEPLVELYLEGFKEVDPVLSSLSLQGLTHFVGVQTNLQDWERVNREIFLFLQSPSVSHNLTEEIGRFFYKFAEQHETSFTEQVLPKLLAMTTNGNNNFEFSSKTIFNR